MHASRFVGRVGGLAVAMGVGAAWFAGGVASADSTAGSTRGDRSSTQAGDDSSSRSASAARATRQARTSPAAAVATDDDGAAGNSRSSAGPTKPAAAAPSAAVEEEVVDVIAESDPAEPVTAEAPATDASPSPAATDPVAEVTVAVVEVAPTPAPEGTLSALPTEGDGLVDTTAGGGPMIPVDSPLEWALLAAARRQPLAAASTTTVTPQATCYLCVDPSVTWGGTFEGKTYDGILVGNVGVTSSLPVIYTALSNPSRGGKLGSANSKAPSNTVFSPQGEFFYLPYATALTTPNTTETFRILVAQQTDFETFVENLPILGLLAPAVFNLLHQVPIVRDLLQPLIGATEVVTFEVSAYAEAQGRPTAFTIKVPSFDGLMVSTNYYPATNVARGEATDAPTVFSGPGLGSPGSTDLSNPYGMLDLLPDTLVPSPAPDQFGSLNPGLPVLRDGAWNPAQGPSYTASTGFNVVTWDPRGEFATRDRSLPGLQIDNPFWEARDVSALISWLSTTANPARTQITMEDAMTGDPLIGMVGGSYGGGIQWVTAGTDPRVDAIVPEISWNSLISSLYPNQNQFKTGFGTVLLLALLTTGAQINAQIYAGVGTGILTGWLSEASQAVLSSAGPTAVVGNITVPTLIMQGMQDVLFELNEAVANAQTLPAGTTKKMVWFCGGHGTCTDPLNPFQDDQGLVDNLKWLDQYVAGNGTAAEDIPNFQWYDQMGFNYTSDLLPYENGFNRPDPQVVTDSGGTLGIWPIIGGSGPGGVPGVSPVLTIGNAAPARNAINVTFAPESESQIVGAPTVSFTYKGLGTSRTVYAQLIDDETGKVLGNLVTPIPVKLDGRERTVEIPLANIGYTTPAGGTLTLQITSSASNFENFTSFGVIDISDIRIDLPIRANEN